MGCYIKFRPIPPRSPHLNGKVERSQLTDKIEFWSRHSPGDPEINQRIQEWQFEYNWRRPHGSLNGKTPIDKVAELSEQTPLYEEVATRFDQSKEHFRHSNWKTDSIIIALHRQRHRPSSEPPSFEPKNAAKRRTKN